MSNLIAPEREVHGYDDVREKRRPSERWWSQVDSEEAEINAALLRLHEVLHRHRGEADLFRRVNQFAVEAIGCDFSSTYVWDLERGVARLVANVGARDEVAEELPEVEFPAGSLPLVDLLREGEIIQVEDAEKQALVPVVLMRSLQVNSCLCVPIEGMDGVAGSFVHGYRSRTGPFSRRQHRLALGIAQISAKALDNARLLDGYRKASELKSEFLATLSHELRTPVHVILGTLECMMDEPLPGEASGLATIVDRQARLLASMIDDLLDLSAIEANRVQLAQETFDPRATIHAAVAQWTAKAEAKKLALSVTVSPTVPSAVTGDSRRFAQVFGNLIQNAIKYTDEGEIEVSVGATFEREGFVTFHGAVRDTGIGISPEGQKRLFEAFSRVATETHRHYGGTGLGLAICKRLTALFNGEIGVESEIGRGSTFWFTLRLEPAPEDATT